LTVFTSLRCAIVVYAMAILPDHYTHVWCWKGFYHPLYTYYSRHKTTSHMCWNSDEVVCPL